MQDYFASWRTRLYSMVKVPHLQRTRIVRCRFTTNPHGFKRCLQGEWERPGAGKSGVTGALVGVRIRVLRYSWAIVVT